MKKNKGFTLIELLAVIVILAIIALVAVPLILNIINRARKSAAEDAAYGVRKEGQIVYQFQSMTAAGVTDDITIEFGEDYPNGVQITSNQALDSNIKYELDGTMPTSGSIKIFKDGKIKGKVMINGYWCNINPLGKITCSSQDDIPEINLIEYVSSEMKENKGFEISYKLDKSAKNVTCKYGTNENYKNLQNTGVIDSTNNKCVLSNLDSKTTYYIQITATDDDDNLDSIERKIRFLYDNGDVVYYNPVENKGCSASEYAINLKQYDSTNLASDGTKSPTGLKTGCMKWHAYLDNESSTTVKLILDHNTTATVQWITEEDYLAAGGTETDWANKKYNKKGGITIQRELALLTSKDIANGGSGWTITPDLLDADDVAVITGAANENTLKWVSTKTYNGLSSTLDINTQISYFYLDGGRHKENNNKYNELENGWQKKFVEKQGDSDYSWLYNYTSKCTGDEFENGCDVADNNNYGSSTLGGYWTSTPVIRDESDPDRIWLILYGGTLQSFNPTSINIGLRPVITVPKINI